MVSKLPNLIQLLKTRGFINQVPVTLHDRIYYCHEYGAPGSMLRHNIKKQWWKEMVHLQNNVFPIEASSLQRGIMITSRNVCDNHKERTFNHNATRSSLQIECRDRYLDILVLANGRLPFSIASTGERCNHQSDICDMKNPEKEFFLRHSVTTEMLLQNYVSPTTVSRILDYWLQLRLSWWKRFSKNPSKVKVKSSTDDTNERNDRDDDKSSDVNGGHRMAIVYDFPWGIEPLEVINNIGDEDLKGFQEKEGSKYLAKMSGTKSVLPHCIQCSTNLELGMAALLVDSFHERKPAMNGKMKEQVVPFLQLHPDLAPFHVAIVTSANQSIALKELRHICRQLEQDLTKKGLSVFNASEHVGTLNAHFKRNDQLGIPYTLILNENSLTDGIISARDRDTEVKKPIHVSKVVEDIYRNIKGSLD